MGARRSWAVPFAVASAVIVASCGGGGGGGGGAGSDDAPDVRRDEVDLVEVFDDAGIVIVDSPAGSVTSTPSQSSAPVELLAWQVDNIEREFTAGSGYLGSELDALTGSGSSTGGVPISYLLAAWLADTPTETAQRAADLVGDQDWANAPAVVFPTSVLVLFVADVSALSIELGWPRSVGPSGFARLGQVTGAGTVGAGAAEGICSTLSGWVNDVLGTLFDALTVDIDDDSDFGWLGDIWNTAVALAGAVVGGLVEILTAPIVSAIADGIAIIGTLTMVASLLQPWSLTMVPSAAQVAFATGNEPDVEAMFAAHVDTNVPDVWPDELVDCASTAGFELPDLSSAAGSPVVWTTVGFPELGSEEGRETAVTDDNTASLRFITGREASDKGDEVSGYVAASAVVTSSTPDALQALIAQLLTDQVPVEPFASMVASLFDVLTEPIFTALATLVQIHGAGSMEVVRHEIDEGRLYDGTWTGLAFSFATATPETLAALSTSEGSESRTIVPVEVTVEAGEVVRAEASYSQHNTSFSTGQTVGGADGSGYGLMTAETDHLSVQATPTQIVVAGSVEERWETFTRSDFPTEPNHFSHTAQYSNRIEVSAVTCASTGNIATGPTHGGRFVSGYWLAHDAEDRAGDLVDAGVRLSATIWTATELPARPADRGGINAGIEALDRAVERYRADVPDGCGIDPILQWAGALRGRAEAT